MVLIAINNNRTRRKPSETLLLQQLQQNKQHAFYPACSRLHSEGIMVRGKHERDAVNHQMSSMEIETYFTAFPALSKATAQPVDITIVAELECDSMQESADQRVEIRHRPAAHRTHEGAQQNAQKLGTLNSQRKQKSVLNGRLKFAQNKKNQSFTNPVKNIKSSKSEGINLENINSCPPKEKYANSNKDVKSWKCLKDLKDEDYKPLRRQASCSREIAESPREWMQLSYEELDKILTGYQNWQPLSDGISSLWKHPPDASGDHVMQQLTAWDTNKVPEVGHTSEDNSKCGIYHTQVIATQAAESIDEYDEINSQISAIKFCEDINPGSKLLKLFGNEQLVRVIKETKFDGLKSDAFCPQSCKHCEDSFEVTLDCELFAKDKTVRDDQPDARLNFDWTKYEPPSWRAPFINQATSKSTSLGSHPRDYCPCQYCCMKALSRTCSWCGTPM